MSFLVSGLPFEVAEEETLARFVLVSKYRSQPEPGRWRVKPPAFIPDPHDDLSVSRVGGLPDSELETYGRPVAETQGKPLYGAALVNAALVRSLNLEIEADEGPPRHANILRWPQETDPKEQKARRQLIATELADAARYLPIEDSN